MIYLDFLKIHKFINVVCAAYRLHYNLMYYRLESFIIIFFIREIVIIFTKVPIDFVEHSFRVTATIQLLASVPLVRNSHTKKNN